MEINGWVIVAFVILILTVLGLSIGFFFAIKGNEASESEAWKWSNGMSITLVVVVGGLLLGAIIYWKWKPIKNFGSNSYEGLGSFGSKTGKKFSALSLAARNIKIKKSTYRWGLLFFSLITAATLIVNIVDYFNTKDETTVGIDRKAMIVLNFIGLAFLLILTVLYWRTTIGIVEAVGNTAAKAVKVTGGSELQVAQASAVAQNSVANGNPPETAVLNGIITATNENPGQTAAALNSAGVTAQDALNVALQNSNSTAGTGILP